MSDELKGNAISSKDAPRPFPYWPPHPNSEQQLRNEAMLELDKWSYNDLDIAKRSAETLILLLARQFDIDLSKMYMQKK